MTIMIEIIKSLSITEIIIWTFFLFLVLSHLVYRFFSYRKLLFYKEEEEPPNSPFLPPVSVIICANNEAENLQNLLPEILKQDYPDFQVVVVNDCSEDNSEEILGQLKINHSNLYYTNISKDPIYRHGKKLAVTLGIKAAKYEHLIFTDADCYPKSDKWLRSLAKHFNNKQIIIGVSPYRQEKGLLGQAVGYETLQTAISYISSALRQSTYMGVGRNMGYTKQLFYDNKGFSGHTHILSGDDDLFINKAATKNNVAVCISENSIVESIPETSWNEWMKQKRRHLTTGKYYKQKQKIRFTIEGAQGFLFYCTFITLLIIGSYPIIALGVFIFRFLIDSTFRAVCARKMHLSKSYFLEGLWLDIIIPIFRFSIMLLNTFKPQQFTWR